MNIKKPEKSTKETIDKLCCCVCNYPHVVNSILTNDHVDIKYHRIGEIIKT